MGDNEISGELISGATLSFFSEVVERDKFQKSHTEIRTDIFNNLHESLKGRVNLKSEKDMVGYTNLYAHLLDDNSGTVEKWLFKCSFLERRGISSKNKPFLESYRIVLTFKPIVKPVYKNNPNYTKEILRDCVKILDSVGDNFSVMSFGVSMQFSLLILDEEIDTGSWKVLVAQELATDISTLITKEGAFEAIKSIDASCRNRTIKGNIDCLFLKNVNDATIQNVQSIFKYSSLNFDLTKYDPKSLLLSISERERNRNCVVFSQFSRDNPNDDYPEWKFKITNQEIASQNIVSASSRAHMQTVKLEVLHKLGLRPLELDPSEEEKRIDGFLYLSRVNEWLNQDDPNKTEYSNILGAILVYGKRPGDSEELILPIDDPMTQDDHDTQTENGDDFESVVNNDENVAKTLSEGLHLSGLRLNIIITKRIQYDKIQTFVEKLSDTGVTVNKIFYFSRYFSSSPSDPERLSESSSTTVSYKVISDLHLFYQPSQRLLGQFDLGTVYTEQLYPLDKPLERQDVVSLIRLSKRRLYRLYNVPSLRIPEPIIIFKEKHKIIARLAGLGKSVPIRLLI